MLTIEGANEELEGLYREFKENAKSLYSSLEHLGQSHHTKAEQDLFDYIAGGNLVYIKEGFFSLHQASKVVSPSSSAIYAARNCGASTTLVRLVAWVDSQAIRRRFTFRNAIRCIASIPKLTRLNRLLHSPVRNVREVLSAWQPTKANWRFRSTRLSPG